MAVKFLIVDDSAVMRKIVIQTIYKGSIFNEENTEIFQAGDGLQGIEAFKEHSPQVVLSDWNMPNLDGLGMVKKIREINQEVPIIMITTEERESKKTEALAPGMATDYIVKPLMPGMLEERLLKAFEKLKGG